MPIQEIELGNLTLSDLNVRKTRTKADIEAMAQSIANEGLIHNLVAHPTASGKHAVVVGGTRLAALQLLLEAGKINADYKVPVEVRPADDASLLSSSLAENVRRTQMNPVEEFKGYDALRQQGLSTEEIAAREGQTVRHVEQRLKLATVSPKLIALAYKGEMTMAQLTAFTVSDKPREQEKVWRELPDWQKQQGDGEPIRDALTDKHIDAAHSAIAKFVGVAAYEAAGGEINRDLFASEGAPGFLTNPKLLNRLAYEKLAAVADPIMSEGWKWVDQRHEFGWVDENKMQRLRPSLTKEQQAEIAGYAAEQERLLESSEGDDEDGLTPVEQQKWDDLEGQIAAVRAEADFTLAQKAVSGVIVTIGRNGQPEIKRGMVKPEDVKAAKKLDAHQKTKAEKPGNGDEKAKPEFSAALTEELTAHRTLAMQAKLASNQKVAMAAIAHALLNHGEGSVLQISIQQPNLSVIGDGLAKPPAAKELAGAIREATRGMPKDSAKQFAWLLQQSPTRVASIIAATVAPAVNAVERKFNGADRQAADQLATALKLDVSQFWSATAEGFFSRVSKDQVLAAVTEAAGEDAAKKLVGMKKAELSVAAEKAVKGKGYLPAILQNG